MVKWSCRLFANYKNVHAVRWLPQHALLSKFAMNSCNVEEYCPSIFFLNNEWRLRVVERFFWSSQNTQKHSLSSLTAALIQLSRLRIWVRLLIIFLLLSAFLLVLFKFLNDRRRNIAFILCRSPSNRPSPLRRSTLQWSCDAEERWNRLKDQRSNTTSGSTVLLRKATLSETAIVEALQKVLHDERY